MYEIVTVRNRTDGLAVVALESSRSRRNRSPGSSDLHADRLGDDSGRDLGDLVGERVVIRLLDHGGGCRGGDLLDPSTSTTSASTSSTSISCELLRRQVVEVGGPQPTTRGSDATESDDTSGDERGDTCAS